jgi:UDP-N-acetylglucosamine transferase subunit ALG13
MIFLTVGTQFPFDRLVRSVDEAMAAESLEEAIFAQIGDSSYRPRHFPYVDFLDKEAFDEQVRKASGLISHAGMGIITLAMEHRKPLLVMPRLKRYGEVVNDHQIAIADGFAGQGYLLAAYGPEELVAAMGKLKFFVPRAKLDQSGQVAARVAAFLGSLNSPSRKGKIPPDRNNGG